MTFEEWCQLWDNEDMVTAYYEANIEVAYIDWLRKMYGLDFGANTPTGVEWF